MFYILLWLTPLWSADGLPHLGVRYTLFQSSVYEAKTPLKLKTEKLKAHSALLPCVVLKNGSPLTGPKGEVLLGYNLVYSEPEMNGDIKPNYSALVEPLQNLHQERNTQLQKLEEVQKKYPKDQIVPNMNCTEKIDGIIDLAKLFPESRGVTYTPPPVVAAISQFSDEVKDIFAKSECCTPEKTDISIETLVKEFHNSPYCTHIETVRGKRKKQLLENWNVFIKEKSKTRPELEPSLKKAMEVDIAARTALYESNPEEGCSASGICEKDVILLSIRNRSVDSRCKRKGGFKLYGCDYVGDIVGVATPKDQYNIWDESIADTTYITSCFLRNDVHPKSKAPALWPEDIKNQKESYQRQVLVFEQTARRAEKILFSKDINDHFAGSDAVNASKIQHYYHPGAMSTCFNAFNDLQYIGDGYAEYKGAYFPVRKEYAKVTDAGNGMYSFQRLKRDSRNTIDPIDDVYTFNDDYKSAKIPKDRFSQVKPNPKCKPYGVSEDCNIKDAKYYRTIPGWLKTGFIPDIKCKEIPASGTKCQNKTQIEKNIVVSGKCNRSFSPVAGVP